MNKKQLLNVLCLSTVLTIASSFLPKVVNNNIPVNAQPSISSNDNIDKLNPIIPDEVLPEKKEITLSFIGDCTIGGETSTVNSFNDVFKKNNNDFDYFFKGVKSVLENDDLTIANLETTFTKETKKEPKQFNFKGDPSYVNILLRGSVEAVNLANNHTMDYCEKGYEDTIRTLLNANIGYFGKNAFLIKEIKGIKFGFAGFLGWSNDKKTRLQIEEAMKYFDNKKVDIKIVTFHWGEEYHYTFNPVQEALGKYAIDRGANLVIGHHPHILQGIQEYNNSYIVYSLGNFVFGGNKNPRDKDTMIFQQTFKFEDGELVDNPINIIPASLSSRKDRNDYQPKLLDGEEEIRIINKVKKYSKNFNYNKK